MAIHQKKIETFEVVFSTEEAFSFDDLITNRQVVEREFYVKGKDLSLRILSKNKDTIIGLVETSRNDNIPPKKNKKKKTISKLGLEDDEGLAYGNVFLYEVKRQILMYEVNKFGCYVDHFIDYIFRCCKNSSKYKNFNIILNPVLKGNEYKRMVKMRFHKSLELQVANPKQIITDYEHENDALWKVCSSASSIGSSRLNTKFEVAARGYTTGLVSGALRVIVDRALEILRGPQGANMQKIIVEGYETDSDDGKLQTIDLIADRYLQYIELDEPRENADLLDGQRKIEIKSLYEKCRDDFDDIFGK